MGKKSPGNQCDFNIDEMDLHQLQLDTAWSLSAGKGFSEDNDNNGK